MHPSPNPEIETHEVEDEPSHDRPTPVGVLTKPPPPGYTMKVLEARCAPPPRNGRLRLALAPGAIRDLPIDARAAYLLDLIDGTLGWDDVVDASALPPEVTDALLTELVALGALVVG